MSYTPARLPVLDASHPGFDPVRAAGFDAVRIEQVLRFYDEEHRCYHTRVHLREMLDTAFALHLPPSAAQALAILFHDAIYVPGAPRGSNESMSAQLMRVLAGEKVDRDLLDAACGIVIDTAEHVARGAESELVLDLDLLRLAVPAADFELYSRQVFAEQRSLIPIAEVGQAWHFFEERRLPFFQRLIERTAIYGVPRFYDKFEEVARSNLRDAIASVLPRTPHEV